nr:hypothetical protein [uncultured Sphingomonas sp.]
MLYSISVYRWAVTQEEEGEFRVCWQAAMLRLRKCDIALSTVARCEDGGLIATALWPNDTERTKAFDAGGDLSEIAENWPPKETRLPLTFNA